MRSAASSARPARLLGDTLDARAIAGTTCGRQRLALLHDLHEQRRLRLGLIGLGDLATQLREQRLGARDRIAQAPKGFVHRDRATERLATLARGPPGIAIGVERFAQVAMALLELRFVQREQRRHT